MTDPVLWIGGWASGLACWRADIEHLYPRRAHRFLDAHAALETPGLLEREVAALPAGGCVAAWSLGSLLLHRALAEGLAPACRRLSLSPIFSFCHAEGPWPKAAVHRMERRLPREREGVLEDFRILAFGGSPVSQAQIDAWRDQARAYGPETLAKGLRALAEIQVDTAAISRSPLHEFFASSRDPLSPAPAPLPERWSTYPSGHLPFLDFPFQTAALLDGPTA